MKELKALLVQAEAAQGPLWLATVVETQGSVYRRAGARMLISQGRPLHGLVSGGCLEGDLASAPFRGNNWLSTITPRSFGARASVATGSSRSGLSH
ncbi:XdhC family protein [bacterium]|nr:XdhC family protein [bacterium]